MAYSLTVAGYTFQNPPEEYRKLARLSNSPQTAFNRRSSAFYQSDSQDLQFQVEGSLALDPPLGESTDDLDELERLQDLAIEGGEVAVEFDPFFSGQAVIEDDPFRQSEGESSYSFTFNVNSETTDSTAYPAHTVVDTGNTFKLGDLNLGYDPSEVSQNYERQTETVKRLQGVARTVDTEGLIPKVTISGLIDGGGQATLWDKARSNTLAYLSAEFQNGWALLDSLSIRNAAEAPDYLTGLFRYDMDLLIVMDPASGIGETSKYVDQEVKGQTQYVSNCGEDGVFERLGDDTEGYPEALDYRVSGGTGKLDSEYVEWGEEYGTLDQSTTNYIWIEDPDADGYGQVNTGTSGFPGSSVPLYEVDTGTSSVNDIRDQRSCLTGTRLDYDSLGDLNFTDDLAVSDQQFSFERLLALADAMAVSDPIERWLGVADLTDSLAVMDPNLLPALGVAGFTSSPSLLDGGSGSAGGGGGTTTETVAWYTANDWDSAVSQTNGMVHQSVTNTDHDDGATLKKGYDIASPYLSADTVLYHPFHEDSGSSAYDFSGNGYTANINGPTLNATALLGTSGYDFDGSNDYVRNPNTVSYGQGNFSISFWINFDSISGSVFQSWFSLNGGYVSGGGVLQKEGGSGSNYFRFAWNSTDYRDAFTFGSGDVGNWVHCVMVVSNGQPDTGYKNATGTAFTGSTSNDTTVMNDGPVEIGRREDSTGQYIDGQMTEPRIINKSLSASEVQAIYDVVDKESSLTTPTKSFSDAVKPDLQNLSYTLNAQTIILEVTGSPGTASSETITQTLDGSTSYTLNWADSHTDFQVKVRMDTADPTVTPTLNRIELSGTVSGGGDADQNAQTQWEILGAKYDTSGNEYEGGGIISRYGG